MSAAEEAKDTSRFSHLTSSVEFPVQPVLVLSEKDFAVDTEDGIVLKELASCSMILFHVNNNESREAMSIWLNVATVTAGPVFAAINMMSEQKVARAFAKLAMKKNHPLHRFCLRGYPFILTYQERYPVGFYNGAMDTDAIVDWSVTYACQGDYREEVSLFPGQEVDPEHKLAMKGRRQVDTTTTLTSQEGAQGVGVDYSEKTAPTATTEETASPVLPRGVAVPESSTS